MNTMWSVRLGRFVGAALCAGLLLGTPAPSWAAKGETATPATPAASPEETSKEVININTAAATELQLLPGIGERKALAIVARREKKKFNRPEELMDVKGIGRGIYKKLKPYVRTQGPTTRNAKVGAGKKGHG